MVGADHIKFLSRARNLIQDCVASVRTVLPRTDPLSQEDPPDVARLSREFNINALSGLIAAQQAVEGFKQVSTSESRTFIFTANALNEIMLQEVLTFGMAKKAVSYMMEAASMAYRDAGFRYVEHCSLTKAFARSLIHAPCVACKPSG